MYAAWREEEWKKSFWWESKKERNQWDDLDVGGRIILK
jgi:hypothetical protein